MLEVQFTNQQKEPNNMNRHTQAISNDLSRLAEDARALLVATAHVAEDKVVDARKRLLAALESAKETCGEMQQQAIEKAKAADKIVRDHPYQAIGIAIGVGALLGYLAARRCSRRD